MGNYDPTAPATPSARTMSSITELSMIPKLHPIVKQVLGGANVPGGGGKYIGEESLESEVSEYDAMDSSTHSNSITKNVSGNTLGDVVRPASMFDTDAQGKIDDPYFRCTANQLCQSVGNQMLQMCICINCNIPAHLFCAEYLMEQNPVEDLYYITVKDLTKEGMVQWKKNTCG